MDQMHIVLLGLAGGVGAVTLFVGAGIMIWRESQRLIDFDQQFPPISDDEYLALFEPGMNPDIALKVRTVLSDALGVDRERIYPSSRLIDDLGAE